MSVAEHMVCDEVRSDAPNFSRFCLSTRQSSAPAPSTFVVHRVLSWCGPISSVRKCFAHIGFVAFLST